MALGPHQLFVVVLMTTAVFIQPTVCDAQPFVAGFERFARHDEINAATAGRLLLRELNCTACHQATSVDGLQPKGGPTLDGAGRRLKQQWIANFLESPHDTKPGTTMPNVLAHLPNQRRGEVVRALTAFLGSLQQPFPEIKAGGASPVPHEFWKQGQPQSGRKLFHQIGCVACHEPDTNYETVATKPTALDQALEELDAEELKELGLASAARRVPSVPLGAITAKYDRQSLTHFLLNPHLTRPAGRMPNFELDVIQAADVAAWLLRDQIAGKIPPTIANASESADLVEEGRRQFTKLGCASCHAVHSLKSQLHAKSLSSLATTPSSGCLSSRAPLPAQYRLDAKQRTAIKAALGTLADAKPQSARLSNHQVQEQLLALNCLACHERNGLGGVGRFRKPYFETVGHIDMGDEGRLPPALTNVGAKLTENAVRAALTGKAKLRPHMRIRMPVFAAAEVKLLPQQLQGADGSNELTRASEGSFGKPSKELIAAGRTLLDVGCVQCHSFRGEALPGVIGVDLSGVASRIHPNWFREFLLNPAAVKKRTRMPTFFPNGVSQNTQVLGGNTESQIAAMWHYLQDLSRQPLPAKIAKSRNASYELTPKDRAIILRTFMQTAGTQAIAVGLPAQVHFAFDAESVRPAIAWRGRFLDAQGTWFVRFAPPADPLGENVVRLPRGVPLAQLDSPQTPWPKPISELDEPIYTFRGFRVDAAGVPTFLYRFGPFDIEDRLAAGADRSLTRRMTITDRRDSKSPSTVWFRPVTGAKLTSAAPMTYVDERGLTVVVLSPNNNAGQLRRQEGVGTEWLIPLSVKGQEKVEVQYQW